MTTTNNPTTGNATTFLHPPATHPAAARTLHLVDLENLAGDPYADGASAERMLHQYFELARRRPGDLVHVAVNPHLALEIGWRLPSGCTLRTASGPDAADRVLLAQAPPEFVARRAGRLVIGSGDHAFIAHACAARTAGVGVLVVARPGSLARGWGSWGFPIATLDPTLDPTRDQARTPIPRQSTAPASVAA